jgi:hypothetical protein
MDELTSGLSNFSVQGRSGADAFRSAMTPYFNNPTFEFVTGSNDMTAQISICRLKKIQIFTRRYEQAFRLKIPDARSFVQGFPVQAAESAPTMGW